MSNTLYNQISWTTQRALLTDHISIIRSFLASIVAIPKPNKDIDKGTSKRHSLWLQTTQSRLQTTQPRLHTTQQGSKRHSLVSKRHSLQAVELSLKLLCKLCRTSPIYRFWACRPCGPPGWLALLLTKAGDVETNPGPTTLNKKV